MYGCVVALLGCNAARTQVMVVVDADQVVRAEASSIHVTVSAGASFASLTPVAEHTLHDLGDEWPFYVPIIPADNDASRVFRVEVVALDSAGAEIVTARRQTGFVAGQTLALPIFLEASCRGMACGEDESCTAGACASAYVPPESLAPYVPPTSRDAGPTPMDGGRDTGPELEDGEVRQDAGFDADFDAGPPICGNGVEELGEACDDGVNDGSYGGCMPGCRSLGPYCGDGDHDPPIEECDDPTDITCTSSCTRPVCGDGTPTRGELCFHAPAVLPVGTETLFEIGAGDLDGDGAPDLAISEDTGDFTVLINNGAGGFTVRYSEPQPTRELTIHDLEGDGTPELIAADPRGSTMCDLTNCVEVASFAGGAYTRLFSLSILPTGTQPSDIQVGYANSDNTLDIAVGSFTNRRFDIAYGDPASPTPSFGGAVTGATVNGMDGVRCALLGRDPAGPRWLFTITEDAVLEAFDLDATGRTVLPPRWFRTIGTGPLVNQRAKATLVEVGGRTVLATVGGEPLLQAFDAATGAAFTVPSIWMAQEAGGIVAADFNSDGLPDLAVSNRTNREVVIIPGTGTGFGSPVTVVLPCGAVEQVAADLNLDGVPDLGFATNCGGYIMLSNP